MPRRSDHAPDELRKMILETAAGILETEGSSGLSARRIAERIGYAAGTIYNYFANLDEVILRVNAATAERLAEAIAGTHEGDAARTLHAIADAYLDFTEAHPRLWTTMFEARPAMAPVGEHAWYRSALERPLVLVQEAMRRLDPDIAAKALRGEVLALWGGLHGISGLSEDGRIGVLAAPRTRTMAHLLVDNAIAGMRQRRRNRRRTAGRAN